MAPDSFPFFTATYYILFIVTVM